MMTAARIMVAGMTVIMTAALVYGFTLGNGWEELRTLVAYPWFNVSLVDVYIGFALFGGWLLYRETQTWRAIALILVTCILGNVIPCLYVLVALIRSGNDWTRFWLGPVRAASLRASS